MLVDPFATLGLDPRFDLDLGAAEQRFRELSKVVHPDRFAGSSGADRRRALGRAVDVNEAWRALRDPISRAEALLRSLGVPVSEGQQPPASQALLMDFLDLREQLAEARAGRDLASAQKLAAEVQARETSVLARLSTAFAHLATVGPDERARLAPATLETIAELRYIRRFLDEVRAIEEDAL